MSARTVVRYDEDGHIRLFEAFPVMNTESLTMSAGKRRWVGEAIVPTLLRASSIGFDAILTAGDSTRRTLRRSPRDPRTGAVHP